MARSLKTKKLRISGVVKAMNQARDRLGRGVLPSEAEDFRRWVRETISEVERISRQYGTKPEKLPAPTFRAYQFLKSIDLKNLPISEHPSNEPANGLSGRGKLRVSNLIAISRAIQREFSELAAILDIVDKQTDTLRTLSEGGGLSKLSQRIETTVSTVEKICREAGSSPADLPGPSSRAYLWLKFLSNPDHLQKHLLNLRLALASCRSAACRKSMLPRQKKLPIWFEFYNLPALYKTKVSGDGIKIVASEAFITAPQGIIESLVCAALTRKKGQSIDELRRYAQSEQFQKVQSQLEPSGNQAGSFSRGKHYDLDESFERVNSEYFQGRMERPVLTWNKTITHRKLGHYQPATDTLMVSISLDRADVPEYLVDYVMYHELLHKALGVHLANGRRYAHTREFRDAERKFHRHTEAEETIKRLGKKLAP